MPLNRSVFITPVSGPLSGRIPANCVNGSTEVNHRSLDVLHCCALATKAEGAPDWAPLDCAAAFTMPQSPISAVKPSVKNAIQPPGTGPFVAGSAITSTPARGVMGPPSFTRLTSSVVMARLNVPCAAISQCEELPGAPVDAITTSFRSVRGSKPVPVKNVSKFDPPDCIWESTNCPKGEFLAAVTLTPTRTCASLVAKLSRSTLLLF